VGHQFSRLRMLGTVYWISSWLLLIFRFETRFPSILLVAWTTIDISNRPSDSYNLPLLEGGEAI
jgi:hypothetical protein